MNDSTSWFVAVDDTTAGPAPTELVVRGIEHRKIPPEAMVCAVGSRRWTPLASVEDFHAATIRSYPPPPPDSEEARRWLEHGFHFPPLAPLPRFADPLLDGAAQAGGRPGAPSDAGPSADEVEVEWDDADAASPIDWSDPFESFFLVGDVELPDERALLGSLASASPETFREESALWNLALCLAYGSDEVGAAAARAFFRTVGEQGGSERLDWMNRTLRGSGFVHSGIPADAGRRAVRCLRSSCPPSLFGKLQ
jgi:hypothetical protein